MLSCGSLPVIFRVILKGNYRANPRVILSGHSSGWNRGATRGMLPASRSQVIRTPVLHAALDLLTAGEIFFQHLASEKG